MAQCITKSYSNTTTSTSSTSSGATSKPETITGLVSDTTYYYRIIVYFLAIILPSLVLDMCTYLHLHSERIKPNRFNSFRLSNREASPSATHVNSALNMCLINSTGNLNFEDMVEMHTVQDCICMKKYDTETNVMEQVEVLYETVERMKQELKGLLLCY